MRIAGTLCVFLTHHRDLYLTQFQDQRRGEVEGVVQLGDEVGG